MAAAPRIQLTELLWILQHELPLCGHNGVTVNELYRLIEYSYNYVHEYRILLDDMRHEPIHQEDEDHHINHPLLIDDDMKRCIWNAIIKWKDIEFYSVDEASHDDTDTNADSNANLTPSRNADTASEIVSGGAEGRSHADVDMYESSLTGSTLLDIIQYYLESSPTQSISQSYSYPHTQLQSQALPSTLSSYELTENGCTLNSRRKRRRINRSEANEIVTKYHPIFRKANAPPSTSASSNAASSMKHSNRRVIIVSSSLRRSRTLGIQPLLEEWRSEIRVSGMSKQQQISAYCMFEFIGCKKWYGLLQSELPNLLRMKAAAVHLLLFNLSKRHFITRVPFHSNQRILYLTHYDPHHSIDPIGAEQRILRELLDVKLGESEYHSHYAGQDDVLEGTIYDMNRNREKHHEYDAEGDDDDEDGINGASDDANDTSDSTVELPLTHQVYRLIHASGYHGIRTTALCSMLNITARHLNNVISLLQRTGAAVKQITFTEYKMHQYKYFLKRFYNENALDKARDELHQQEVNVSQPPSPSPLPSPSVSTLQAEGNNEDNEEMIDAESRAENRHKETTAASKIPKSLKPAFSLSSSSSSSSLASSSARRGQIADADTAKPRGRSAPSFLADKRREYILEAVNDDKLLYPCLPMSTVRARVQQIEVLRDKKNSKQKVDAKSILRVVKRMESQEGVVKTAHISIPMSTGTLRAVEFVLLPHLDTSNPEVQQYMFQLGMGVYRQQLQQPKQESVTSVVEVSLPSSLRPLMNDEGVDESENGASDQGKQSVKRRSLQRSKKKAMNTLKQQLQLTPPVAAVNYSNVPTPAHPDEDPTHSTTGARAILAPLTPWSLSPPESLDVPTPASVTPANKGDNKMAVTGTVAQSHATPSPVSDAVLDTEVLNIFADVYSESFGYLHGRAVRAFYLHECIWRILTSGGNDGDSAPLTTYSSLQQIPHEIQGVVEEDRSVNSDVRRYIPFSQIVPHLKLSDFLQIIGLYPNPAIHSRGEGMLALILQHLNTLIRYLPSPLKSLITDRRQFDRVTRMVQSLEDLSALGLVTVVHTKAMQQLPSIITAEQSTAIGQQYYFSKQQQRQSSYPETYYGVKATITLPSPPPSLSQPASSSLSNGKTYDFHSSADRREYWQSVRMQFLAAHHVHDANDEPVDAPQRMTIVSEHANSGKSPPHANSVMKMYPYSDARFRLFYNALSWYTVVSTCNTIDESKQRILSRYHRDGKLNVGKRQSMSFQEILSISRKHNIRLRAVASYVACHLHLPHIVKETDEFMYPRQNSAGILTQIDSPAEAAKSVKASRVKKRARSVGGAVATDDDAVTGLQKGDTVGERAWEDTRSDGVGELDSESDFEGEAESFSDDDDGSSVASSVGDSAYASVAVSADGDEAVSTGASTPLKSPKRNRRSRSASLSQGDRMDGGIDKYINTELPSVGTPRRRRMKELFQRKRWSEDEDRELMRIYEDWKYYVAEDKDTQDDDEDLSIDSAVDVSDSGSDRGRTRISQGEREMSHERASIPVSDDINTLGEYASMCMGNPTEYTVERCRRRYTFLHSKRGLVDMIMVKPTAPVSYRASHDSKVAHLTVNHVEALVATPSASTPSLLASPSPHRLAACLSLMKCIILSPSSTLTLSRIQDALRLFSPNEIHAVLSAMKHDHWIRAERQKHTLRKWIPHSALIDALKEGAQCALDMKLCMHYIKQIEGDTDGHRTIDSMFQNIQGSGSLNDGSQVQTIGEANMATHHDETCDDMDLDGGRRGDAMNGDEHEHDSTTIPAADRDDDDMNSIILSHTLDGMNCLALITEAAAGNITLNLRFNETNAYHTDNNKNNGVPLRTDADSTTIQHPGGEEQRNGNVKKEYEDQDEDEPEHANHRHGDPTFTSGVSLSESASDIEVDTNSVLSTTSSSASVSALWSSAPQPAGVDGDVGGTNTSGAATSTPSQAVNENELDVGKDHDMEYSSMMQNESITMHGDGSGVGSGIGGAVPSSAVPPFTIDEVNVEVISHHTYVDTWQETAWQPRSPSLSLSTLTWMRRDEQTYGPSSLLATPHCKNPPHTDIEPDVDMEMDMNMGGNELYKQIVSAGSDGIAITVPMRTLSPVADSDSTSVVMGRLLRANKIIEVCSYGEPRYVADIHAKQWIPPKYTSPPSTTQNHTSPPHTAVSKPPGAVTDTTTTRTIAALSPSHPTPSSSSSSSTSQPVQAALPHSDSSASKGMNGKMGDKMTDVAGDVEVDSITTHAWSTLMRAKGDAASETVSGINSSLLDSYEYGIYSLLTRYPATKENALYTHMKHIMSPAECGHILRYMESDEKLICKSVRNIKYWYTNPLWGVHHNNNINSNISNQQ